MAQGYGLEQRICAIEMLVNQELDVEGLRATARHQEELLTGVFRTIGKQILRSRLVCRRHQANWVDA